MRYLKTYNESESDDILNRNQIWSEIEDILTPISDADLICVFNNYKYPTSSKSSIQIKKDWTQIHNSEEGKRYFNVKDVKDELNHLCSRFPGVINQIQLFRQRASNPVRYTPDEFVKMEVSGFVFLVAITLKIEKEGAKYIPT